MVTTNYNSLKHELAQLPVPVAIDVYEKMCVNGQLCQLSFELGDLNVFMRTILHGLGKQHVLHRCVQALMDHGSKTVGVLAKQFTQRAALITSVGSDALDFAKLGQILATFLFDAGWYAECEQVLTASLRLVADSNDSDWQLLEFNLTVRLLSTYNNYCQFANGRKLFEEFSERIERGICASGTTGASEWNIAQAYIEFSSLFFMQSKYDDAYKWSMRALSALTPKSPVLTTIDVLRQAAKSCVVKRSFKRAELLITQALIVANQKIVKLREDMVDDVFADASELHPKISDLFSDYGFYLLNVDLIAQSVKFYDLALGARLKLFTGKPCDPDAECNNLLVAISCEDLAYSTYVFEYSSGRFEEASMQAERALKMMQKLLPSEHLLLASAKRIKALILEEIAIDHHDKDAEKRMLKESQELHLSALDLAIKAFGNDNVQTAKHYGNLGRLYQSMHNYEEAETMHLKAIAIKESLLGPDDFGKHKAECLANLHTNFVTYRGRTFAGTSRFAVQLRPAVV